MFKHIFSRITHRQQQTTQSNVLSKNIEKCIDDFFTSEYYCTQQKLSKYTNRSKLLNDVVDGKEGRSAPERLSKGIIEMILGKGKVKLCEIINGIETDIYIPSLKVVYEIQGFEWHYKDINKIINDKTRLNNLLESENVSNVFLVNISSCNLNTVEGRFRFIVYNLPFFIETLKTSDKNKDNIKHYFQKPTSICSQEIISKCYQSKVSNFNRVF